MIKRHFSQHILHRNKQVVLNSHLLSVFLKMEGDGGVLISPSNPNVMTKVGGGGFGYSMTTMQRHCNMWPSDKELRSIRL